MPGHYERKQLLCRDRLIAWATGAASRRACGCAALLGGKRVLDTAAATGLSSAADGRRVFEAVCPGGSGRAEIDAASLSSRTAADATAREGMNFMLAEELTRPRTRRLRPHRLHGGARTRRLGPEAMVGRPRGSSRRTGALVVSVPVETGLPLVVKQRGGASLAVAASATIRAQTLHLRRDAEGRLRRASSAHRAHGAQDGRRRGVSRPQGFNWMRLRDLLSERFTVELTLGSPSRGSRRTSQVGVVRRAEADMKRVEETDLTTTEDPRADESHDAKGLLQTSVSDRVTPNSGASPPPATSSPKLTVLRFLAVAPSSLPTSGTIWR